MPDSIVGRKGQTTIPAEIRKALQIQLGDWIEYVLEGAHATIRVLRGLLALEGALANNRGRGMTFSQIRTAAAKAARDSAVD